MQRLTIILLLCAITTVVIAKSSKADCKIPHCRMTCPFGYKLDKNGCATCACKKSPCDGNKAPLDKYFCGKGPNRKDCPSTHRCVIAPNDSYAVCCPLK
ncbi:unnamed protein product [Adineta ricciae]|uniref:Antistasin-like domain-containing protein n=1 Tax=Adineta ricciae TaxID=249248 RepID=A0A815T630_ADIRI|nr:unnamed protein product [Adineta ricciae]